ncbi:hypothetical protein [Tropicimonas sediminicola]|uniref:hypothetical protein n=1 Tax=Tropicimonas sediminicola TaxID=1031541 RepID=UPI00113170A8|nr:hypothetical protein [Tropicimonas sediminicola]
MTKRDKAQLDALCQITEIGWAAAGQGLRDAVAAEREISGKLAALAQSRHSNLGSLNGAEQVDSGTFQFISDWLRWSERERQRLNLELARRRAALEAEQAKARKAFGRREAARQLRDRG